MSMESHTKFEEFIQFWALFMINLFANQMWGAGNGASKRTDGENPNLRDLNTHRQVRFILRFWDFQSSISIVWPVCFHVHNPSLPNRRAGTFVKYHVVLKAWKVLVYKRIAVPIILNTSTLLVATAFKEQIAATRKVRRVLMLMTMQQPATTLLVLVRYSAFNRQPAR